MNVRATVALILIGGVAACTGPEGASTGDAAVAGDVSREGPVPLTAQQQRGRVLFETMCWTCHGPAGRGDGPAVEAGTASAPPTFHSLDFARAEPAALERRFRVGVGGVDPAHPHMQYVASLLAPENFADALAFIPALSYPAEIPGSALAGERLYQFRCAPCHGQDGRGTGTAVGSLVLVQPVDFTADSLISQRDWDGLFVKIKEGGRSVHGSSMPPWGIVLSKTEIWDLVAYLATFQSHMLRPPYWVN